MKKYRVAKINKFDNRTWQKIDRIDSFISPWLESYFPKTNFQACHDEQNLYFKFEAIDNDIKINQASTDKMAVNDSDRVELFFSADQDLKNYYCLEMAPCGKVMDFEASYPKNMNFHWSWPKGQISIHTEMNDGGYVVHGWVSLSSLEKLNVLIDNQIMTGIFRANCIKYNPGHSEFEWISWVNPNTEKPDFHRPSAFGLLCLQS